MGADYRKANRSLVAGNTSASVAANATRYIPIVGSYQFGNEEDARIVIPFRCIFTYFSVRSSVPPGAGEDYVYTILLNGAPTTLTLTIGGGVDVVAGPDLDILEIGQDDELSLRLVTSLNAGVGLHNWSLELRQ